MACRDSGTICCSPIFILRPGMRHSALLKSNSVHSPCRNSPGRTNTSGARRSAQRVVNDPMNPSVARSSSPAPLGSVTLAWCCTLTDSRMSPSSISRLGSRAHSPWLTAYRKTRPHRLWTRLAISFAPRPSILRRIESKSGAARSVIGRLPIKGKTSNSRNLKFLARVVSASEACALSNLSRATSSKEPAATSPTSLLRSASSALLALRTSLGRCPLPPAHAL